MMNGNLLGVDGACHLMGAVKNNKFLTYLGLQGSNMTAAGKGEDEYIHHHHHHHQLLRLLLVTLFPRLLFGMSKHEDIQQNPDPPYPPYSPLKVQV
jgi:hypothetical protein